MKYLPQLALLTVSLMLGIYVIELALPILMRAPSAAPAGAENDSRTKFEVVEDLRRDGVDAWPAVTPRFPLLSGHAMTGADGKELFPLAGISNVTTVLCNETGEFLVFRTDERGFHNPPGSWEHDGLRMAVFGDSFAHGACVPSETNLVANLRRSHPRTLNLGMTGTGPLLMLATLAEYLKDRPTDVVLWFHYEGNDLEDLDISRGHPLLQRYLEDGFGQRLVDRQEEIDNVLRDYVRLREAEFRHTNARVLEGRRDGSTRSWADIALLRSTRSLLYRLRRAQRRAAFYAAYEPGNELHELLDDILQTAARRTRESGARFVFVYLPSWEGVMSGGMEQIHTAVLAQARDLGVDVIDLRPVLSAHEDPASLFSFPFSHYNERGYALAAEHISGSLFGYAASGN